MKISIIIAIAYSTSTGIEIFSIVISLFLFHGIAN